MPRPLCATLVAFSLALGAGACDWRAFDSAVEKAPVDSFRPPSGYKARDVGRVVLPLKAPGSLAARYLVAGTEAASMAIVDFEASGKRKVSTARETSLAELTNMFNAPVGSAVELADGSVLVGTPNYGIGPMIAAKGRVFYVKLNDTATGVEVSLRKGGDPGVSQRRYGLGVAVGNVAGAGDKEDHLIVSEEVVTLVEDGDEGKPVYSDAANCPIALDEGLTNKYQRRAIIAGDVMEGDAEEIIVGLPREGFPGRVFVFKKAMMDGKATLECPVILEAPQAPGGKNARFGSSLAVGDLDGNGGRNDLVVGAPPDRAYVYLGPLARMKAPTPIELKHPDVEDGGFGGDFGYRVLVADVDGGGAEIFVSAPDLIADGVKAAGQVVLFKREGAAWKSAGKLWDHDPEENGSFGVSLAALRFKSCKPERPLVVIGAPSEVFTFFRLPVAIEDPRCF